MDIALRLDVIDGKEDKEVLQQLHDFIVFYSDVYLVTHEYGSITNKSHYHVYMRLRDNVVYQSVRKQWKRKFEAWSGRGQQRSISQVTSKDEYLSYITKDGDVVKSKGVDLDSVKPWVKATGDAVIDKIMNFASSEASFEYDDCLKIVYRYYLQKKKIMNYHQMKAYANLLFSVKHPEEGERNFLSWAKV